MTNYLKIIAGLVLALFFFGLLFAFLPYGEAGKTAVVSIESGESFTQVVVNLKKSGVIQSRTIFGLYAVLTNRFRSLKAGTYEFVLPVSIRETALIISKAGAGDDVAVTIPEGFTLAKIAERLEEAGIAGGARFESIAREKKLEGYLFPDTYRFYRHDTAEAVVERFLENFKTRTKGLNVAYQKLILASILEKEVPVKDMPLAAGVLQKRLNAGVPLQADATLVYALGRPITASDPETLDSPYNTYRYLGFPPTPISNPGLEAIKAALNPAASEYWYYLSRRDNGETIFSATLEEHNAARAKYLR